MALQVVSVQYQVVDSQISDDSNTDSLKLAFYKLTNPHRQITSCVLPLYQRYQALVLLQSVSSAATAECVLRCTTTLHQHLRSDSIAIHRIQYNSLSGGGILRYVFDVVRAVVPKIDLDNVFIAKEEIAQDVQATLTKVRGATVVIVCLSMPQEFDST